MTNTTSAQKKVVIMVPIYNEESVIAQTVRRLVTYSEQNLQNYDYQVVVVDNNSKDRSREICEELEENISRFKYIHLDQKGKGLAIKYAMKNLEYDYFLFLDADLATDETNIEPFLEKIEKEQCDMVIASRAINGSKVYNRSLKRTIIHHVFRTLIRILSGVPISDFQCGFKLLSKRFAAIVPEIVTDDKFFLDAEMIITGYNLGYRFCEMPVTWTDDPNTTVKVVSDSNKMFSSLISVLENKPWKDSKYSLAEKDKKLPYDNFKQIGLFLFVGGTSFIIYYTISLLLTKLLPEILFQYNLFGDPNPEKFRGYMLATGIAYIISAIWNFILNRKLTFQGHTKSWKEHAIRFAMISSITGILLTQIFLYVFTVILKIPLFVAMPLQAGLIMIINYLLHHKFTYK